MDKKFTLEHQYNLFLKRMNLKEKDMVPLQRKQLKQTFYGAIGQLIILLRDELSALPEEEGFEILKDMLDEVGNLFLKDKGQSN